ncbi:MAG: endonuclease V [Actinomycetota bacterium]|nr:endonuclease V [Actinomycetota bacterium]
MWPEDDEALAAFQHELADAAPEQWTPGGRQLRVGGCWVCFPLGLTGRGQAGDPAWAASVAMADGGLVDESVVTGQAGAPYVPGLLAMRIGRLMEQATRGLATRPDVLLLDATGRDHPRRAGLALHLGAALGLPTIGITHRPLLAEGEWPPDRRGATSPLRIGDTVVGCWMRTQPGVRPVAVHPGWAVDLATAVEVVAGTSVRRTPEPLRGARQLARRARAGRIVP